MPIAVESSWDRELNTSQSWPMRCIQVPTLDTSAPANQMR